MGFWKASCGSAGVSFQKGAVLLQLLTICSRSLFQKGAVLLQLLTTSVKGRELGHSCPTQGLLSGTVFSLESPEGLAKTFLR
jgi:hypothetical protein